MPAPADLLSTLDRDGFSEDTIRHRRTLHLEFSAVRDLPDGYEWHTFIGAAPAGGPPAW